MHLKLNINSTAAYPGIWVTTRELLQRAVLSRVGFWLTVAAAASLVWLAPRPPMADLPQHVGQVALWQDLLLDRSPWAELLRINLMTPYLIGYALALGFSFLMPVLAAFKLVISLACVAFVGSCIQLRRDLGGDHRLDYLFIPGFFGFAYDWGLYSFLVASPIGLQFIRMAWRFAKVPTLRDGGLIVGLGICLLFAHGLVFLFAGLIGGALLITHRPCIWSFASTTWPYAFLALACGGFFLASRNLEAPASLALTVWDLNPFTRLIETVTYIQSNGDGSLVPLTVMLLYASYRAGCTGAWRWSVPLVVTLLAMFLLPNYAYGTGLLSKRMALFVLPFWALTFCAPKNRPEQLASQVWVIPIAIVCWLCVGVKAERALAFGRENADFETILAAAEPGRRAAAGPLVADISSPAAHNPVLAMYQPHWYMHDNRGLVEFNFAYFHPQVVRYKTARIPSTGFGFNEHYRDSQFDWSAPHIALWDYFFVRKLLGVWPAEFIANPRCQLRLVKEAGSWGLFERGPCQPLAIK
jgi:hypothetical protein